VGPAPRNILIVVLIAAAVYAIPGGGTAAGIVSALISVAFAVAIWLGLMYVYRNFRTTIYSLGDRHRAMLYASLASILFLGASADRFFDTPAGTFVWLTILGAAVYGVIAVFRQWRSYA
jgi:hypothetical protein